MTLGFNHKASSSIMAEDRHGYSGRGTGHWALSPLTFGIFLIFSMKSFADSFRNSYTKFLY